MWGTATGMGWWMVFGSLLWLAFWGTIVWLIVSAMQQRGHRDERAPDEPIELAKRRYAKGEIGRDEYQRIRDDLAA